MAAAHAAATGRKAAIQPGRGRGAAAATTASIVAGNTYWRKSSASAFIRATRRRQLSHPPTCSPRSDRSGSRRYPSRRRSDGHFVVTTVPSPGISWNCS